MEYQKSDGPNALDSSDSLEKAESRGEEKECEDGLEIARQARLREKLTARPKAPKKPKKIVPMRAFWGVFSQSFKQVAQFPHAQHEQAVKRAVDLSEKGSPHFVRIVKREIKE